MNARAAAAAVAILLLCTLAPAQTGKPGPGLELQDGRHAATGTPARAGVLRVWEDRAAAAGRLISLEVIVLPATGPAPRPDPVFIFAGGPGQDATSLAGVWAGHWMRADRDIVLVSQRGTGGDNRLWCDLPGSEEDPQGYLGPIFEEDVFRECLERLAQDFDLTQYSTVNAADDVNELRVLLGYEKINLYGGSYGSRAELEYVRRHAGTVRVAILNGVAPVSFINPLYHARGAQDALDLILDQCAADPACAGAYGDVRETFEGVMGRLARGPVETYVIRREDGRQIFLTLDRDAFAEALRVIMYYDRSQVPYLLSRAAAGDFTEFAERAVAANRALRETLAFGMLLCVTCAEDVDRITEKMIVAETSGTFLGDSRVREQRAVCAFWPRSTLPADAAEPVRADVPVLLLSGRYDPVTPPAWGEEAASHLARSLHVIGPGSHGLAGPCIDSITAEVLERGTVDGVDVSCVDDLRPTPFRLPD